ncbi:MAG: DotU family type IV/VI secretion system protein [Deltaproteobacteria bacterium]|jgi:hypothetical protein|nr:DotU family type IV/VI secretion system protein [Deltaproteobacteria bacterium]
MRFAQRYFEFFHYALQASPEGGSAGGEGDLKTVREGLEKLLKEEEKAPLPPGYGDKERREALLAVMVWVDERLLTYSAYGQDWYPYSLQRAYLDTNQGGSLFFRRLEDLLKRRRELMEEGPGGLTPGAAPVETIPAGDPSLSVPPVFPAASPSVPPSDRPGGRSEPPGGPEESAVFAWKNPGHGPEPLEGVLDVFALCLVMGFQGRYSQSRGPGKKEAGEEDTGFFSGEKGGEIPLTAAETEGRLPFSFLDKDEGERFSDRKKEGEIPSSSPRGDLFSGSGGEREDFSGGGTENVLSELFKLAKGQLAAWRENVAPDAASSPRTGIFKRILAYIQERGWILLYILIPLSVLGLLYLRSLQIVEKLPF